MRYFAFAAIAALAACGNVGSVISDYGPVRPEIVSDGGLDWKIYDKPEENRMMVAATVASISKVSKSSQMPILDELAPYKSAAQAALSPRGCSANSVKPLIKAQMEVSYTC